MQLSATKPRSQRWQSAGTLLLLLAAAFLMAGCQSSGEISDRPLLPLFSEVSPAVKPARMATFGTPISTEQGAELIRTSAVREVPEVKRAINTAEIAAVPSIEIQPLPPCFAREMVIDLDTAFRVANVENPRIGLAEELVRAQLAEQTLAKSLLYPTLNVGTTLTIHRGPLLAASGTIRDVDRESLYFGAGADVRGAGTVAVPGVHIVGHLGDAVFAPRVAQQKVQRSQFDAAATQNSVLLDVARAYLGLVSAEARWLALRQSETELAELAKLTADFAAKGAGREADAMRTAGELGLLRTNIFRVEEETVARATELARLLSADATVRLRPEPGTPPLVQLIDDHTPLESLIATAEANRPEIAARSTEVAINQTRLRQERIRPFLPTVLIGFSAGEFGGGSNQVGYRMNQFNSRTDLDVAAVWRLQNLGVGNRAIENNVRAQVGIAEAHRVQAIDRVRREVTEAFSRARTSRHQIDITKRRVETAQQAYRQDLLRTKDQLGRLVEVLSSFNLLVTARQELVQAMVGYSQSQFELYVALGETPAVNSVENR
jgi:outer membrane protein TolC